MELSFAGRVLGALSALTAFLSPNGILWRNMIVAFIAHECRISAGRLKGISPSRLQIRGPCKYRQACRGTCLRVERATLYLGCGLLLSVIGPSGPRSCLSKKTSTPQLRLRVRSPFPCWELLLLLSYRCCWRKVVGTSLHAGAKPKRSKYPILKDSGSKYHTLDGLWDQGP